jgi:hypothetical protein
VNRRPDIGRRNNPFIVAWKKWPDLLFSSRGAPEVDNSIRNGGLFLMKVQKTLLACLLAGAVLCGCDSSGNNVALDGGGSGGAVSGGDGGPGEGGSSASAGGKSSGSALADCASANASAACGACVESKCAAPRKKCFGENYSGGLCADYVACASKAADPCRPTECAAPSGDCLKCITTDVGNCEQQNCEKECGGGDAGSTSSGDATCADLNDCCSRITNAGIKSGCENAYSQLKGDDMRCRAVYDSLKSYCP